VISTKVIKIYTKKLEHLIKKDKIKETLIVELEEYSAT
jgi:hypothetical protein